MKNIFIVCVILLLGFTGISGQDDLFLKCTVLDEDRGYPIRAVITSNTGEEFTLTNKEGVGIYRKNILQDSLWTVDAVGYLPYAGQLDSIIRLKSCISSKETIESSAKSLVVQALGSVSENYVKNNQFYYGFFNETILENRELNSFSEGIVQSFKGSYQNNFGFDQCYEALENETSILLKGNKRNNFNDKNKLQFTAKGYLLPKTLDPLSICSSPLIAENLENFEFSYESTLQEIPEPVHIIRFENEVTMLSGKLYIGKETYGIYKIEVDEQKAITTLDSKINEVNSNYVVDYLHHNGYFFLSSIVYEQKLYNSESDDSVSIISNYITTRKPIFIDSLPPRREILTRNKAPEPFISLHPHRHFAATQIIARARQVTDSIAGGEKINFDDANLNEVIKNSQINANLIFLYIYAENDSPSRQMEEMTFNNQEVVSYLNSNFTCSSFSIDEAEDNGILYMADLEFLPSYIIMTPLGQIIQIFDGFILPASLLEILEFYKEFNVSKLFYAYDKRDGSEGKKIKSAYLDLFRQLRDIQHPNAIDFISFFEDETKNWETPEAKNVIFEFLIPSASKKYNEIFLNNISYYESIYSKEEVAKKLYLSAFQKVLDESIDDYKEFNKYLNKNAPAYADSLYSYFLVEYFSTIKINKESYIVAVIEYLNKYHTNNWPIASRHLMTVAINTENISIINRCLDILKSYEGNVTEYEYLDVYSLLLYKSGKEKEALELVNKIKSLARKNGVNYEVALKQLSSSGVNE